MFYLLINFFQEKIIPEEEKEENIKLLIENKKRASIFTWIKKNLDRKKKFLQKSKKKFFLIRTFFYVKFF